MLRDPDRLFASPLISEPAMENEPDSDLRKENCWVVLEEAPREALRCFPIPLV